MVGGLKNLEKIAIFEESVLTFVDIVQSSRLEKINQRSILGCRFFNVKKYGKIKKKNMFFKESCLTFVDIVQSSRFEKLNQRSILGFRFFNVEKYGKI